MQGLGHKSTLLIIHFCCTVPGSHHTPPLSSSQPHHRGSAGTPVPALLAYAASQCDVLQSHPACGMPEETNKIHNSLIHSPPLFFTLQFAIAIINVYHCEGPINEPHLSTNRPRCCAK